MAVIESLLVRMGLDPAPFERGERQSEKALTRFEKRMDQLDKAATVAGIGAGVALGAGFVKALDVENGRAKLSAQLDLTGKEAERIGKSAGKIFSDNFGDSMETVNEAVKSVIQNMDGMRNASSAALEDTTKRALTLAETMGEDVSKVTAAVSQMLRTGLAPNAKVAFDVLQRGAALGANKAEDLLDTFNEYPTQFRDMGLSAEAAMGVMIQGLQAGARDSDIVADAFKELNIRIQDMSGAPALKELGLSAQDMATAFGKGGKTAATALDTIFDRLRAVKDPTDRYRLSQQLLGAQSEDVSKALLAIDPSEATKKLGNFAGATDRAMTTLGGTAQGNIESFKRTLMTSFVDVIGKYAIPAMNTLMDTAKNLGISPDAIVALGLAFAALALSVKLANGALVFFKETTIGMAIASRTAAAAQWAWNAALAANPIGLIILAVVAVVGILIFAYKKFDWFRNFVDGVWRGIVAVAQWAYNTILKPLFAGLQTVLQWVGAAFKLLWAAAQFVWTGISQAAQLAWKILQPIFKIIGWWISNIIIPIFKLLMFVVKLVWWAIQTNVMIMWRIVQKVFKDLMAVIKTFVIPTFNFLFRIVKTGISIFIVAPFRFMMTIVRGIWNTFISVAKRAWNLVQPVFNGFKRAVGFMVTAFRNSVRSIGKVWSGLQSVVKKPVSFVVNTVYGKGIKGVWDRVAKMVHLPMMPDPPKFKSGGPIRGRGGPRSDSNLIAASTGEYMVNAKRTRAYFPLLQAMNFGSHFDVLNAMGMMGDPAGGMPGYADGGIIGAVGGFFKAAKNGFMHGLMKAAGLALNPLINATRSAGGGSPYGELVTGTVKELVGGVLKRFKPLADQVIGGANAVVRAARTQIGVPYVWGGTAWGRGLDCSGLTSQAWLRGAKKWIGRTTYAQIDDSRQIGRPVPGALGFPHSGHVVMYTDHNKVIQAPYTGARVNEGPISRSYQWRWPNAAGSKMDNGYAHLRPGWNSVYNGTGGTETVRRTSNGGGSDGGDTIVLENHGVIGSKDQMRQWFLAAYEDARKRKRVP